MHAPAVTGYVWGMTLLLFLLACASDPADTGADTAWDTAYGGQYCCSWYCGTEGKKEASTAGPGECQDIAEVWCEADIRGVEQRQCPDGL